MEPDVIDSEPTSTVTSPDPNITEGNSMEVQSTRPIMEPDVIDSEPNLADMTNPALEDPHVNII